MSTRTLTAAMQAAAEAGALTPILLFEGEFDSGALRLWSGLGPLTWDSKIWSGGGGLLSVAPATETVEVAAAGAQFQLGPLAGDEIIALALSEHYQQRPARLWFGALDAAGAAIVDPVLIFAGRMDVMTIDETGDMATITLTAENRLADLTRPRPLRYTDAEQQELYPGDRGLEFVADLADREVIWK